MNEFSMCLVLYCLMFIVMFHIPMQLMQRLDHWNELYVRVFGKHEYKCTNIIA